MTDTFESLFIEIGLNKKILIGIIYRPPGACMKEFNMELQTLLDPIRKDNIECYIMGDLNINLINSGTHTDTASFLEVMYGNSFIPLINKPTRITERSATLIDHIFTNTHSKGYNYFQGVLITDISDHYPVFHISQDKSNPLNNGDNYRMITAKNEHRMQAFKDRISNNDWSFVLNMSESEPAFNSFYNTYKQIHDEAFPLNKQKITLYKSRLP